MEVGIDTLNFNRIIHVDKLAFKILSSDELEYFNNIKSEKRRLEYVAGRFSLKESFVKASNLKNVSFKDITILNDEFGKPILTYLDYKTKVSISHERTHVVSICIIE